MASPDRHFANGAFFTETVAPDALKQDHVWLYAKSDGRFYGKDDSGTEFPLGSGGIGGTTGNVDNAILRADGTGGSTVQPSSLIIEDETITGQPNIAIVNNHTLQVDSSLVLTPKGNGAIIAGARPNGLATGGLTRGSGAIDFQMLRQFNYQVASGYYSVISGGSNNNASGSNSTVGGGGANIAEGASSVVSGGSNNNAEGIGSSISGGNLNHALADYSSISGGYGALADRYGIQARANGYFGQVGDAQSINFVMRGTTISSSFPNELFVESSTNSRFIIPNNKLVTGTIFIAGIRSDGSSDASYMRQFSIKNINGTTSLVGTVNTIGIDQASGTSISITANDDSNALKVEVTGINGSMRWVALVNAVEVKCADS